MKDRRELLKGLLVGSVWATPVVSSAMLPAHAATSVRTYFGGDAGAAVMASNGVSDGTIISKIASVLVPPAQALLEEYAHICGVEVAGGIDITFQNKFDAVRRNGIIPLPGDGSGSLGNPIVADDYDCRTPEPLAATLIEVTESQLVIDIRHGKRVGVLRYTVPTSDSCQMPDLDGNCR